MATDFKPVRIISSIFLGGLLSRTVGRWLLGQRITAVAALTVKSAFRYRLFWVMAILLVAAVVLLPLMIRDDGTARGFTQIVLTYTLGAITALLGLATLWLGCGVLARDIEESQMQMVVVKPIARWQIWIGKWLGIVILNAILLALAGGSVFALMLWRADKLPEAQKRILRSEVLVARSSMKEPPVDVSKDVEEAVKRRIEQNPMNTLDVQLVRKQLEEQMKAAQQIVAPNYRREWVVPFGLKQHLLRDQPLFVRYKFMAAQTNESGTYVGLWRIGPFEAPTAISHPMSVAADTFNEFSIPGRLIGKDGNLRLNFINDNETALLFSLDDGLEVLYRDGGFGLNFFRGLAVIFCWLALFAAIGLAAASFLSFPVAAFFSVTVLIVGLSGGTLSRVMEEGSVMGVNHETGVADHKSPVDYVMLPLFGAVLKVVNLVEGFSPIDSLSSGRSITWGQLGRAFAQIVLLLGGLFALLGIYSFSRRELATAQNVT